MCDQRRWEPVGGPMASTREVIARRISRLSRPPLVRPHFLVAAEAIHQIIAGIFNVTGDGRHDLQELIEAAEGQAAQQRGSSSCLSRLTSALSSTTWRAKSWGWRAIVQPWRTSGELMPRAARLRPQPSRRPAARRRLPPSLPCKAQGPDRPLVLVG